MTSSSRPLTPYAAAFQGATLAISRVGGGYATTPEPKLPDAVRQTYLEVKDALVRQGSQYATHTQPAPKNEATEVLHARDGRVNLGNNTRDRVQDLDRSNPKVAGIIDAFAAHDGRANLGNSHTR